MFEQVKKIIVEELGKDPADITPDADIRNDLGVTSLELVETIMAFEDTFDIVMDEDRLAEIKTVGDLADYIKELTA